MIILKSAGEIAKMRRAGRVVAETLARVREAVRPGVPLKRLDELAYRTITRAGAKPSFLGYQPRFASSPFPATLCLSPNNVIIHGIPDRTVLKEGDILAIDCGAMVDGYHGDAAITVPVGEVDEVSRDLIATTERALAAAIERARPGNRLGDVGAAVEEVARAAGYGIVPPHYGGHGIGQAMHEEPLVPNYGPPGRGLKLRPGLVLAIEPMLNVGAGDCEVLADGWTVVTRDGSRSAHFEHTVAITPDGPEVLTRLD